MCLYVLRVISYFECTIKEITLDSNFFYVSEVISKLSGISHQMYARSNLWIWIYKSSTLNQQQ